MNEPRTWYVIQREPGRGVVALHVVTFPGLSQPGGYVQLLSFDAWTYTDLMRYIKTLKEST